MQKVSIKKFLIQISIFLILIIGTMSMFLKGQDFKQVLLVSKSVIPKYLIIGIGMSAVYVMADSLNIKILLSMLSCKITVIRGLKYACNGIFFSAITPGATGGQPVQVYSMKKDGIEIAEGSLVLLIQLACYQFILVCIGIVSLVTLWSSFTSNMIKSLAIVGISCSSTLCGLLLFTVFSKMVMHKMHRLGAWIINKIPFKTQEKRKIACDKWDEQVVLYGRCSNLIKEQVGVMVSVVCLTIIQIVALLSIPYFVYKALGGGVASFGEIILLQGFIRVATSFVPVPGGVGISEGVFLKLYQRIYSVGEIKSAMLLSRGISFYLVIVTTGIILAGNQIIAFWRRRRGGL
ncbi:MAG: lysylphosphatidylglycerol synthase transmembrane domain-containing protein [Cellulosilyticaceae bacterium]